MNTRGKGGEKPRRAATPKKATVGATENDEIVRALLALVDRDVASRSKRRARLEARLRGALRLLDPDRLTGGDLDDAADLVHLLSIRIEAIRNGLFEEHHPPSEPPPEVPLPAFSDLPPEAQKAIRAARVRDIDRLLRNTQGAETTPRDLEDDLVRAMDPERWEARPEMTVPELSKFLIHGLGYDEKTASPAALHARLKRMRVAGFAQVEPTPLASGRRPGRRRDE